MKRDKEEKPSKTVNLSRREAAGWLGAAAGFLIAGSPTGTAHDLSAQAHKADLRSVQIVAKPSAIAIDVTATVVLVIDMQNDFCTQGGMLDRLGMDITTIRNAVLPTARVIAGGREAGMKIIYLKMAFKPDLSDIGPLNSPNWNAHHQAGVGKSLRAPDGTKSAILIRDTWNTEIIKELKPEPADIQIYKNRYSGFFQTDLDKTLKRLGARYLIVTGCTTSVCVESTIRDAAFRDYSCVLLADCTGEPLGNDLPRSNHEASLFLIAQRNFGWVSSSDAFLGAI